jgi:hypothetical protein
MAEIFQFSSADSAISTVNAFAASGDRKNAWQLDRAATLNRLVALLRVPDRLHQRGLNACGPAVLFRMWLARDPVAVANFAIDVLRTGSSLIGSLPVAAGSALLAQDYIAVKAAADAVRPGDMPETADWMLLSTLRDAENDALDYLGEPGTVRDKLAGMTLPGALVSWLKATSMYSSVEDRTNLVQTADRQALLDLVPAGNSDVPLFVHHHFIAPLFPEPVGVPPQNGLANILTVPDHYVLLNGRCILADDPGWTAVDCWSWGDIKRGFQGTERLFANYFGMVIATI